MYKILTILLILMSFSFNVQAQIIQKDNQTVSYTEEIKLEDFIYGLIFKSYDNQYYIQSKLLHSLNKGGYIVTLEDCQIISDNYKAYLPIRASEVYCGFRQKFSIKLDKETAQSLKTTHTLQIILPYYKDGSDLFVQYKTISVPKEIIKEWQTIIK